MENELITIDEFCEKKEDQKKNVFIDKKFFSIPANSIKTISFVGHKPNFFKITSIDGEGIIIGLSMIPNWNFYDVRMYRDETKIIAEPSGKSQIYINNPIAKPCNIILTAFEYDFDAGDLLKNNGVSSTTQSQIATIVSDLNMIMPDIDNIFSLVTLMNNAGQNIYKANKNYVSNIINCSVGSFTTYLPQCLREICLPNDTCIAVSDTATKAGFYKVTDNLTNNYYFDSIPKVNDFLKDTICTSFSDFKAGTSGIGTPQIYIKTGEVIV